MYEVTDKLILNSSNLASKKDEDSDESNGMVYGSLSLGKACRSIVNDYRYNGIKYIVQYTKTIKRCVFFAEKS